jgi:hypothetical protein
MAKSWASRNQKAGASFLLLVLSVLTENGIAAVPVCRRAAPQRSPFGAEDRGEPLQPAEEEVAQVDREGRDLSEGPQTGQRDLTSAGAHCTTRCDERDPPQ